MFINMSRYVDAYFCIYNQNKNIQLKFSKFLFFLHIVRPATFQLLMRKRSLLNYASYAPSCLRALPIIDTRLTCLRAYAPYQLLIRALALINRRLTRLCLVLCCVVTIERWGTFCVSALINHSLLLYFILPIKVFGYIFSFFYFKSLVTPLLIQFFCNII